MILFLFINNADLFSKVKLAQWAHSANIPLHSVSHITNVPGESLRRKFNDAFLVAVAGSAAPMLSKNIIVKMLLARRNYRHVLFHELRKRKDHREYPSFMEWHSHKVVKSLAWREWALKQFIFSFFLLFLDIAQKESSFGPIVNTPSSNLWVFSLFVIPLICDLRIDGFFFNEERQWFRMTPGEPVKNLLQWFLDILENVPK